MIAFDYERLFSFASMCMCKGAFNASWILDSMWYEDKDAFSECEDAFSDLLACDRILKWHVGH